MFPWLTNSVRIFCFQSRFNIPAKRKKKKFVINSCCKNCARKNIQQLEHYTCFKLSNKRKWRHRKARSFLFPVTFYNFTTFPDGFDCVKFIWLSTTDAMELKLKVVKHSEKFNFRLQIYIKSTEALQRSSRYLFKLSQHLLLEFLEEN